MGRLLRFLVGVLLVFLSLAPVLRFGRPTYLALPGTPVDATIVGPCDADRFLIPDQAVPYLVTGRATRCGGRWTRGSVTHRGDVLAADAPASGSTVSARAFAGTAYVPPAGPGPFLAYGSLPVLLLGLHLALKSPPSRRRARRTGDGYDGDDDHDSEDSGGDGGGGDGGGGDGGGGDGGGGD